MLRLSFSTIALTLVVTGLTVQSVNTGLAQSSSEDDVELLDVFEVSGTVVERETRQLTFLSPSIPSIDDLKPVFSSSFLQIPGPIQTHRHDPPPSPMLDPLGKVRGIRTSVKPLKAPRPSYPRFAREQGWEGTSVLRVTIDAQGEVLSAVPQKSSGFPVLDESAAQAVNQWAFAPAKNGEFAVSSTVDIPIRFDLDRSN